VNAGPYYVSVLLGHNDACTNTLDKTGNGCAGDRDPENYCRTTPAAFEREFRRGMDELIQIAGVRVAVLAVIRISQLCNFEEKDGCGPLFAVECKDLWGTGGLLEDVFGSGGVCTSLTSDCSDQRRIDMYETLVAYNEVLSRVSAEYAAVAAGGASATGAVKADNVAVRYVDATFRYRLQDDDLSCCDCFHPSDVGQRKLARFTWNGIECSDDNPCCAESDNPLTSARCASLDVTSVLPGGFWANGVVCGNGILDPDETCDDGNQTDGDGCPAQCGAGAGGTPSPTPTATPDPSGTVATGTPDPSGTPDATVTPDPSGTPDTTTTPAPSGTPDPTRTPPAICPSDCSGDGSVTVNELVAAVSIALGLQPVSQCPAADHDGDGSVTVNELVVGVLMLQSNCG
jgi:cysteine-rich repeat protein